MYQVVDGLKKNNPTMYLPTLDITILVEDHPLFGFIANEGMGRARGPVVRSPGCWGEGEGKGRERLERPSPSDFLAHRVSRHYF